MSLCFVMQCPNSNIGSYGQPSVINMSGSFIALGQKLFYKFLLCYVICDIDHQFLSTLLNINSLLIYYRTSEHQPSGGRGSGGLSKSRTVDAFGEGPPPKPKPGRSPSSLSLLESRFRQEPKDPEQPRTGMFSSSFLSGVSSAVSSASIPKFSLFGDEEDAAKQGPKSPGPQQAASKATRQQGPAKSDTGGSSKPSGAQQVPAKSTPQSGGPAKSGGLMCPLCKTTELNLQAKDQPPNYSTCTQCKQQVCSLCGFSPPDSEVRFAHTTHIPLNEYIHKDTKVELIIFILYHRDN